jgi:IPT/TIG domain
VPLPLYGRLVKTMNMISFFARLSARSVTHLRIAAFLIGLLLLPAFAVGQAFVQVNSNTATSAPIVPVTYTAPETAGNLNVVVVGWSDTTSSVVSVVDDNTNTYRLAGTTAGHGLSQAIYYAPNILVAPHATPTVTVTFNQPAAFPDVRILEYSGLSTTFPLDTWTGNTGVSTAADSLATTTTQTDLILGAGTTGAGFTTPGAGFTTRLITPVFGDIVEDSGVALPAGSHNATATLTNGSWLMQVAGFSNTPITFAPPVIDAVTPISRVNGPSTGGTQVTIFGSGFQKGATIFFGTAPGGFSALNCAEDGGDTISCFTPAHPVGPVDVTVVNVDGQASSSTPAGAYTFVLVVPPTFTSVVPATGATNGGTPITITGTQFQNNATVTVNNLPAANVVVAPTSITASTPALPVGTADVTVKNPDGGSITAPDAFTYALGTGSINYVQGASAATGGSLTVVPVTMSKVQTAGNLNVVIIGWNDTTATVSSVTDTEGNTYTIAAPLVTGTGLSQAIFFAKNIVGEASNPNEVTVTFSQAAVAPDVRVLEYKGLDITNPVDVTAGAPGTSNLADSGPCTTTTPTELVVAGATVASSVTGPGTGFTAVALTHPNGDNAEHQITSAVGSCEATAVVAGGNWVMQTVAFKAAALAAAADFTIAASALAPATVAPGASATSTITIAPVNGFNAAVALTCTVAPAATRGPTCAFGPASVPGGTGTSTLTVSTTAATTASLEPRSRGLIYAMLLFPIGGLALLGTGITSRKKKKIWGFLLGCILFSTLIILPACGGGNSSGGGGGGGGHPGTPAGLYTVTVTGTAGSLTHTATASVTVN